jgi:NAD(P)H-dependent flavin oxidoreductase YrpB (nitropropane dioxygenase family)
VRTPICDQLGIAHPIFAFTPSEHVAAAVSRAGGLGVLGCVRFNEADELDAVLSWMDENTDGKPYGVDVVMPAKVPEEGTVTDLSKYIPDGHRKFVDDTLRKLGVPPLPADDDPKAAGVLGWLHSVARSHVDVALQHPIKLIANALGSPPKDVIDLAHEHGVPVAALAGKAKHARSHVDNGVDIVIAQGTEAGGHTGEIATMVLVPDVVDAMDGTPVLAAGGIATGRQMAAALSLGAAGVWTGSVWLTTQEAETHPVVKEKMLAASASDTVRSRSSTGKHARQLVSAWTREWEDPANPDPLGMPHHSELIAEAKARIGRGAHVRGSGSEQLVNYFVGQVVGRMRSVRPARRVLEEIVAEYADTVARIERINAG